LIGSSCKMATSDIKDVIIDKTSEETEEDEVSPIECAICLQTCIYPVQLPCKHIFCFLCVKGATTQSKRCAMCRAEIPPDYLDHPELIASLDSVQECTFEDGFQWFYEGRNGWWLYDERTGVEIEQFYKSGEKKCELLIAGFLYIIDFEHMMQFRRNDPNRRRQIKRDAATVPKKGVAGLRAKNGDEGSNVPAITADSDDQTVNSNAQPSQQQVVVNQNIHQAPQPSINVPDHPSRRIFQHSAQASGSDQQPLISNPSPPVPPFPTRRQDRQPTMVTRQDLQQANRSMRNQQLSILSSNRGLSIVRNPDGQMVGSSNRTTGQPIPATSSRMNMNQPRPIILNPPDQQNSTQDISDLFSNLSVRVSSSLPNSGFYWGSNSSPNDVLSSGQTPESEDTNTDDVITRIQQPNPEQQDQPGLQQRSLQRRLPQ